MAVSQVRFVIADRSHDARIRALLRESSMAGDIALSFQTEPSYFDAAAIDGEHHAIVALDGEQVICLGGIAVRERYFNGMPQRIGYLGRLRLAASHAGRFDILRRGYARFRELYSSLNIAGCFTSIAAENIRARQMLERGLPGFPIYKPAGELVTLVLRANARTSVIARPSRSARNSDRSEQLRVVFNPSDAQTAATLLWEKHAATFQFHPRWPRAEMSGLKSPQANQLHFLYADDRPVGCAAVWDQRPWKQTVVTRYSSRLRFLRPLHNVVTSIVGRGVSLPAEGSRLEQVFASYVALPVDQPQWLLILLSALIRPAAAAGACLLAIGLDARDPRLTLLQRCFSPLVYRTQLYTVNWLDEPAPLQPDGRLLYPEIALL